MNKIEDIDGGFFAEVKCRFLQSRHWGATPPTSCEINGCGKSKPTFTPSIDSVITYKRGLQLSVFYFCNKHGGKITVLFQPFIYSFNVLYIASIFLNK